MKPDTRAAATPHTDIVADGWVGALPGWARPYALLARWDRPIGTWLLYLPCVWGIALAGDPWPDAWLLVLFGVGAVLMRGAGCTINDWWDRDLDRQVERTRGRPLAAGLVSSRQAILFIVLQSLLAFGILVQLTPLAIGLGVLSLVPVILYPLAKRVTDWPQAVLGLTFNWGVPMGFAAASGTITWGALVLYVAGLAWTLGYDTIYAHQDRADDALIGVRSTARRFGARTREWVGGFYAATIGLVAVSFALSGAGALGFAALAPVAAHFAWQVARLDIDDPALCLRLFRSNREAGLLVALAVVLGRVAA